MSIALNWPATSARDLVTTDIGHARVRMQRAVFADRDGATSAAGQPLRDLLEAVARRSGHGWC
jgi:hypothetical protein